MILIAALVVAAAVLVAAGLLTARLRARQRAAAAQALVRLFAPALAEAARDPRALLVWQPLATLCRTLDPESFARLDQAAGGRFPFPAATIEAAHARWTADWLAWERAHDAEYTRKAAAAEEAVAASGGAASTRAGFDAVEREKLETYQRRYEEYKRVARALQDLTGPARTAPSS